MVRNAKTVRCVVVVWPGPGLTGLAVPVPDTLMKTREVLRRVDSELHLQERDVRVRVGETLEEGV